MYHQQFSDLQVKLPPPKVPNMEIWFLFLQEAPAILTERSVFTCEVFEENDLGA